MHFDEKLWIAIAFALFISLIYKKLTSFISKSLDKKLENIKAELHKAETLKKEAQDILENYKKEQEKSQKQAQETVTKAEKAAADLLKKSKEEIKANTKNKIAEIETNITNKRENFVNGLRQEIVDQALNIVEEYLSENKELIGKKSYSETIEALEKTKIL